MSSSLSPSLALPTVPPTYDSPSQKEGTTNPDFAAPSTPATLRERTVGLLKRSGRGILHHLKFVGPGIVASVAYFDPGNWSVDLQAGSAYGYKLLFVVLMAGLGAILLQVQATRLGIVTGLDLARHTRLLLHDRPRHKMLYRWGALYPIYVLVEIAIIATDLAELLGSAIALNLLFPKLPLYAGVLLTSLDVLLVLAFFQRDASDNSSKGTRTFEILICCLVFAVFGCFTVLVVRIEPQWNLVFEGYLPSKTVFGPGALYVSIGIIGATVMPHALFIGSRLATVDRLDLLPRNPVEPSHSSKFWKLPSRNVMDLFPSSWQRMGKEMGLKVRGQSDRKGKGRDLNRTGSDSDASSVGDRKSVGGGKGEQKAGEVELDAVGGSERSSVRSGREGVENVEGEEEEADERPVAPFDRLNFIRKHITHATVDIIFSLLGFAVTINSAILVIAAAAFFYRNGVPDAATADLFDAHELIGDYIGSGAALLFAIALLCSGQSASITATLAGQVVSEGFIEWKTSPFMRRILTRLISIVPAIAVAVSVGRDGIDTLLVASQVVLSIVLPFVIAPLVYLTSSNVMVVNAPVASIEPTPPPSSIEAPPHVEAEQIEREQAQAQAQAQKEEQDHVVVVAGDEDVEEDETRKPVSFKASKIATGLGWLLFSTVVLANSYVIVTLAMGGAE